MHRRMPVIAERQILKPKGSVHCATSVSAQRTAAQRIAAIATAIEIRCMTESRNKDGAIAAEARAGC
jgi:hypothetical protein